MNSIGCFSLLDQATVLFARMFSASLAGIDAAILFMMPDEPSHKIQRRPLPIPAPGTQMSTPDGYTIHQTVDLGGRIASVTGSQAMYNTLVNMQSGPRVLGETVRAARAARQTETLVDSLMAFGSGSAAIPTA